MEPAAKRREHRSRRRRAGTSTSCRNGARRQAAGVPASGPYFPQGTVVPQWSPPLSGGSTILADNPYVYLPAPQWSPPSDGGSTAIALFRRTLKSWPQWSPPSEAGVCPCGSAGTLGSQ